MATLKWTDGKTYTVPDDKLQQALADGFQPLTAEDNERQQAADEPVRAGVEGLARGASFGTSDPFLIGFGVKREGLKLRKEENPVASTVGEIGGAVGTGLLTGGGASALAGGGMRGAVGESGLYGMGSMVSESALENSPLTTERLAAGFMGGAVAGGVAHGALSAVSKGISLGIRKTGGSSLQGVLKDTASKLEQRSLAEGFAGGVKKLERRGGSLKDVVEYAQREGLPIQFNEDAVAAVGAKLKQTGDTTAELVAKLDPLKPLTDGRNRAALADKVIKSLEGKFKGDIAAESEVTDFIAKEIEPLVGRVDLKWPEVYKLQSRLRGKVEGVATGIKKEVYDSGRKALRDVVFAEAEAINPGVQGQLKGLQADYAKGAFLSEAIANRIAKNQSTGGVTGLGLMDVVRGGGYGGTFGAAIGGPVGAPLGALAGAYANRAIREKGASVAANALRSMAEGKVLSGVSRGLSEHLKKVMTVAPELLGAYRYPLAQAAAQGADALMAEHIRLASGPQGSDYLSRAMLEVESAAEVEAAGQRFAVLDSMQRLADQQAEEMDLAVDGLFGTAPGRKGGLNLTLSEKDFMAMKEQFDGVMMNPEKMFETIPADLRAAAPAAATETAAASMQAMQYLMSKAPKNPYEGMPPAIAPQWAPSPAELDQFNRYREAVVAPANVLKNMAKGYISPEQVEAIQAVYPAMYADLQQKISERLMMLKKPLAYQQRAAIAAIIGPGALGMSPQQVQILQQTQMLASGQDSGQGKPTKGPDGRQDVNEAQIQTESQKLEGRV